MHDEPGAKTAPPRRGLERVNECVGAGYYAEAAGTLTIYSPEEAIAIMRAVPKKHHKPILDAFASFYNGEAEQSFVDAFTRGMLLPS